MVLQKIEIAAGEHELQYPATPAGIRESDATGLPTISPAIMPDHPSGLPYPESDKAYENLDFLHSPAARNIRVQCELTEPEDRLRRQGVKNTIVFFGSARTLSEEDALANLDKVRKEMETSALPKHEKTRAIARAEMMVAGSAYYEAARQLAHELADWSKNTIERPERRFYICSGGGPGIMEAANRGAAEAGERTLGLGISLPFEQHNNPWITKELNFEFHYFFVRKYWFLYLAKCMVVFPGGFGTFDELFEMLTLVQTKKTKKNIPIILFGSAFWNQLINFDVFVRWGVISEEDIHLFKIIDTVEEARDYIIKEMTDHYLHRDEEHRHYAPPKRMDH